jgi:F0F1-type ATP synthase membrane subunit b/b'
MKKTTILIYAVYFSLLATMLPHTAWAFGMFEQPGLAGAIVSWCAALTFEGGLAVLTYKLAKHIETAPKKLNPWRKFAYRYLNSYSFGMGFCMCVSSLANLAHAVEFGTELAIFVKFNIPFAVYALAFGGVLPLVSLMFARVLSNVTEEDETESATNPELEKANTEAKEAKRQLRDATAALQAAEGLAAKAEQARVKAEEQAKRHATDTEARHVEAEAKLRRELGEYASLFAGTKQERILAIKAKFPNIAGSAIAELTGSAASYVSEVLKAAAQQ